MLKSHKVKNFNDLTANSDGTYSYTTTKDATLTAPEIYPIIDDLTFNSDDEYYEIGTTRTP